MLQRFVKCTFPSLCWPNTKCLLKVSFADLMIRSIWSHWLNTLPPVQMNTWLTADSVPSTWVKRKGKCYYRLSAPIATWLVSIVLNVTFAMHNSSLATLGFQLFCIGTRSSQPIRIIFCFLKNKDPKFMQYRTLENLWITRIPRNGSRKMRSSSWEQSCTAHVEDAWAWKYVEVYFGGGPKKALLTRPPTTRHDFLSVAKEC